MGIDDPISLSELLEVHDLRDVLQSFAGMHGVPVSVIERQESGQVLLATNANLEDDVCAAMGDQIGPIPAGESGSPEAGSILYVTPVMYQGETIARVVVGPYRLPPLDDSHDPAIQGTGSSSAHTIDRSDPFREISPGGGIPVEIPRDNTGSRRMVSAVMDDDQAGNITRHIATVLEVLVHNAYARYMISALHTEATKANFDELEAKNQRLEKAVERMQEVDRLKSSFLATMSHELRTPLTSVIGYSEMLIEGLAGELKNEQREYMKTILSKAEHLLQLISGILDVSMLETGSIELRRDPVMMPELLESVIATVRPTLRKRQINFLKTDRPVPPALGDRQKIRDILRNLLTNAIKFTPEGGQIEITLDTGPLRPDELEDDRAVQVTIADSGIGMSPDEQARIFEPFFQVDSSSTRRYGGSGLGLTLAKRYVEALGGNIWVDSTPGSGSSFTVALPAKMEEKMEEKMEDLGSPADGSGEPAGAAAHLGAESHNDT